MQRPAALVDAHSAPMDIHFYPAGNFPSEYLNAAFVAYRAGFLGPDPGHKVVALFVDPDGSNATVGDFMTGFWPNPPDRDNIWGKPVGLTSDSLGNLYLSSDWINNLILRVEYKEGTTGIREEESEHFALSATLEQNYPNPFNPTTTIRYTIAPPNLPKGEAFMGTSFMKFVTLKVYDILGKEIVTLVNEEKPAGTYEVEFSAKGGSASGGDAYNLPSGIYFYRLTVSSQDGLTGDFIDTKKLILLK
jgi:hypothetical protein